MPAAGAMRLRGRCCSAGREVTVTVRVERSWIEEPVGSSGTARRRMFQVRLEDGRRCHLA
jgi:hypothetical protein